VHTGAEVNLIISNPSETMKIYLLFFFTNSIFTFYQSQTFDYVIIAHPLELTTVEFENFPAPVISDSIKKRKFQKVVAHFVKGQCFRCRVISRLNVLTISFLHLIVIIKNLFLVLFANFGFNLKPSQRIHFVLSFIWFCLLSLKLISKHTHPHTQAL
jgi:hypothetical protein